MNARRYGSFFLGMLLCLAVASAHARRVALVIGNDNYYQVAKLEKAVNDADAMARELELAGFEVKRHHNLTFKQMVVAFEIFFDLVKGGDEVTVFYAGHGVQTDRGSYLLPTDIEGETQSQIEKVSYSVNGLLEELDRIKPRFSLIVVDACRDNPLRSRGRSIGVARGLNAPDLAKGQMVIFSAGKNQKALDSLSDKDTHPNGLFTREFTARMRRPGLSVEALAIEVKSAVEQLALSVNHNQRPLIVNDSSGDFYFAGPSATALATPGTTSSGPANESVREDQFWQDSKAPDNVEGYEAYLGAYPSGRYAGLARANIARFKGRIDNSLTERQAPAAPAAPSATPPKSAPIELAAVSAPAGAAPRAAALAQQPPPATVEAPKPVAATTPPPVAAPPATDGAVVLASYTLDNGDKYEGETVGAIRSGRGKYQFANGDRYEGELQDNSFTGKGVMVFASGDRYEGEFKRGIKQGKGIYQFANRDRYEGQFSNNQYHGVGALYYASGDHYVGDFVRGIKEGRGVYSFANGERYEGPYVDNVTQGVGVYIFASGDRYEGEFKGGVKQGKGVYRFASGGRYEGDFVNNVFEGRGKLFLSNGDRYEGDFRNNMKEGVGVHFFASGGRHEGTFRAGLQAGMGTHFFANGDRYEGMFEAGVRHGKGTLHLASGPVKELEFVRGAQKGD